MNKTNYIIVHGSNENEKAAKLGGLENTRHWHPWIKEKLEKEGHFVSGELYPEDWKPEYNAWKEVFEKNKINKRTILIGHSAGCGFILRWLMDTKNRVKKVILVAPYVTDDKKAKWLKEFVNFSFNKTLNKSYDKLTVFYDKQDMPGIVSSANLINNILSPKMIELRNHGHFTLEDMKTREFPELLSEALEKEI